MKHLKLMVAVIIVSAIQSCKNEEVINAQVANCEKVGDEWLCDGKTDPAKHPNTCSFLISGTKGKNCIYKSKDILCVQICKDDKCPTRLRKSIKVSGQDCVYYGEFVQAGSSCIDCSGPLVIPE